MAELNRGPAHPQSCPPERYPGPVIVQNFAPAPSDCELGMTFTNKNDMFEMGGVPSENMNVRYAF
jgi:hypothetical protein